MGAPARGSVAHQGARPRLQARGVGLNGVASWSRLIRSLVRALCRSRQGEDEMERIGVVDTMFARVDMGAIAERKLSTLAGHGDRFQVLRRTVPGMKDLAVAAKRLIEADACSIVIACGMPGPADIDQICAHEASQGIMLA